MAAQFKGYLSNHTLNMFAGLATGESWVVSQYKQKPLLAVYRDKSRH